MSQTSDERIFVPDRIRSKGLTIAIEGPSCSGKTTLLKGLQFYPQVGEYFDYMQDSGGMPPMQSSTLDEAKRSLNAFIQPTNQISEDITQILQSERHPVVISDRSVLTLFATRYALVKMQMIDTAILDYFVEDFIKNCEDPIFPSHIIYIDVSHDERWNRRKNSSRGAEQIPLLYNENFNHFYREYFIALREEGFPVTIVNGECTPDELQQRILTQIWEIELLESFR